MANEQLETERHRLVKGVGIPAVLGAGAAYLFALPMLTTVAIAGGIGYVLSRPPKAKGKWDASLSTYTDGSPAARVWVRDPTYGVSATDPTKAPTEIKYITLNKADGSMSSVVGPAASTTDQFGHAMDVAS